MFRASSCPSSGATTTAVAASGLPSELGDSIAVVRVRAGRPCSMRTVKNGSLTHRTAMNTWFRRQLLRKLWPIQLRFRLCILCKMFLSTLTLWNTSPFSRNMRTWSILSFSSTFQNLPSISDLLCKGSNSQDHAKPHSECAILAHYSLNLSPLCWRKEAYPLLNAVFVVTIRNLIWRLELTLFVIILPKQLKYSTFFRSF
jgi:hypothetical protein